MNVIAVLLLYIVRHAKSSWANPDTDDLERPLTEKGIDRTKQVAGYLKSHKARVDLILSSHAVRARETAKILAHGLGVDKEHIRVEKGIYTSDEDDLFDQFLDIPGPVKHLMLVGHNPTLTRFVNRYMDEMIEILPTSGVVCLEFDTKNWSSIIDAPCKVKFKVWPRMLT